MITRIAVALFALYCVHGSENSARDGARLAEDIQREVPKAAVSLCLDNVATCSALAGKASGLLPPAAPKDSITTAESEPVAAGLYPLPPRRPASFAKKA